MKILLNEAELSALAGLPHLAIILYVMAIRPRMDYGAGTVGDHPRISWQALTEWAYIEPARGIKSGSPSKWQAMRAVAHLEKSGLVKMQSSISNAQLRMFLPLAQKGALPYVQKKPATNPQGLPARAFTEGKAQKPATPKKPKPAIHQVSGSTNNQHHNNNGTQQANIGALLWCDSIGEKDRTAIAAQLSKNQIDAHTGQQIIDEIAGAITGKGVSNKSGFARTLIARALSGEFAPERGNAIAEGRLRRAAADQALIERDQATPAPAARDIEKGAAFLQGIRTTLKRRAAQ
jgi:hypothetical protein